MAIYIYVVLDLTHISYCMMYVIGLVFKVLHLADVKKHGVASPYEPSANDHGSLRHPVDGFDHTNDRLVCKIAI